MKYKNLFFILFISMISVLEISAMQLVVRRVPKSIHRINAMHPIVQKRNYAESGEIIAGAMMILPLAYLMGQAVPVVGCLMLSAVCEGSHRVYRAVQYARNPKAFRAEELYYQIADIGSEQCSFAYIKKLPCGNPCCCKNLYPKRTDIFDDINQERYFLRCVREGLQKLNGKEKEVQLLLAQNKIDTQGCQKIIGLLEHKKDCYIRQIALFDDQKNEHE